MGRFHSVTIIGIPLVDSSYKFLKYAETNQAPLPWEGLGGIVSLFLCPGEKFLANLACITLTYLFTEKLAWERQWRESHS